MSTLVDRQEHDDSYFASLQILKRQCSALRAQQKLPQKESDQYYSFFDYVHYLEHHHEASGFIEDVDDGDVYVSQTRSIFMAYPPMR